MITVHAFLTMITTKPHKHVKAVVCGSLLTLFAFLITLVKPLYHKRYHGNHTFGSQFFNASKNTPTPPIKLYNLFIICIYIVREGL